MIVRILGQGQWLLEPEKVLELNEIDEAIEAAVEKNDADALRVSLKELNDAVRAAGAPVPDDVLAESDLVLPDVDATIDEVRALLDAQSEYYGLIPEEAAPEGETAS